MVVEVGFLVCGIIAPVVNTFEGEPAKTGNKSELQIPENRGSTYMCPRRCAPMCFFNSQQLLTGVLMQPGIGQGTYGTRSDSETA